MSHSNGKIQAPIDLVGDVAAVLGVSTYDVVYLCSNAHGKINKWAKYKPVRYDKVGELTEEELKSTNYGLDLGNAAQRTSNPLDETWRGNIIGYLPPRPGTDWSRLTDFNGYSHNAQPPISPAGEIVLSSLKNSEDIHFANYGISQTTDLTIKDFPYLADYYPCVVISYKYNGGVYYQYATAANKFGSAGPTSITIRNSDLNASWSDLKYFMCGFSGVKTSLGAANVSGYFISLPSAVKLEGNITRVSASTILELGATGVIAGTVASSTLFFDLSSYQISTTAGGGMKLAVGSTGTVSLRFSLTNKTASAITVGRTSLFFKPVGNLAGSTIDHISVNPSAMYTVNGRSCTSVSSVSVPANGSVTIALTFNYAAVTNNSGTIVSVSDTAASYMQIIVYYGSSATSASQIGSAAFNVKK